MVLSGGSQVLAADLRLDNREELARELDIRSEGNSDSPDVAFLSAAHLRWAHRAPERLLGAFAYAAWEREANRLVCGRDHFGEKPLYYFHAPGRLFAFASEIKALWVLREIPTDLDDLEIARHLHVPVAEDLGSTYYRAIRRLRPGHILTVTPEGVEESRYWELDVTRTLRLRSDAEYAEAVRNAFVEAVRCRVRTTGPVASMLSGGIDSSSVTSVAARLLAERGAREPVRTLSAVYPDVPASDERGHIEAVIRAYGTEPTFFAADRVSPIAEFQRLTWQGDGAVWAGNLYLNQALYQGAAIDGARVVLDGFDGDSTVSHGHGWLSELAHAGRWWTLLREVKAKADVIGQPWRPAVWAWIRAYGVAPARRRLMPWGGRRMSAGNGRPPQWTRGLAPDFVRELADRIVEQPGPASTEREHHRHILTRSLLFQSLSWIEAVGAGAGVEVRFPFFDRRLIDLCVSMPPEQKLRRGWSRFVMRKAMEGILPPEVQWRRDKADIGPGFYHTLRAHAGARIGETMARADERIGRYLDQPACVALHERLIDGTASSAEQFRAWRIASLALWLTGSHGVHPRGADTIRSSQRRSTGAGSLIGGIA